METLVPIILIAVIFLVIGFILGNLFSTLRAGKKDKLTQPIVQVPGKTTQSQDNSEQDLGIASQASTPVAPLTGVDESPSMAQTAVINPVKNFKNPQTEPPAKKGQPKSMVAQIDEILQEKLVQGAAAHLPPEKRAIRLMETPGRGVSVIVGLDQYEGLDGVPDEEVRTIIREAVTVWENQKSFE